MQLQIGLAIAPDATMSVVDDDAADFFFAPNQLEKMRNDRAFHAALEKVDKFPIDYINAAENKFFGRSGAKLITHIHDPTRFRIKRNMFRSPSGAQGERNQISGPKMTLA